MKTNKNLWLLPTSEVWKDVIGYEGLYQVSNFGNVKSLGNKKTKKEKVLKASLDGGGYLQVSLQINTIRKTFKIHKLVSICFLNHKPDGTNRIVIDHINENKLDNRLVNLRLVSNRENLSNQKGTSIFVGVYFCEYYNKWISKIQVEGKQISLGSFGTENDAKNAYQNALILLKNNDKSFVKFNEKSSNHKGVSLDKKRNKWVAQIKIKYKRIFLGRFETELEASNAYQKYLETLKDL
jgi:hypothetical protein